MAKLDTIYSFLKEIVEVGSKCIPAASVENSSPSHHSSEIDHSLKTRKKNYWGKNMFLLMKLYFTAHKIVCHFLLIKNEKKNSMRTMAITILSRSCHSRSRQQKTQPAWPRKEKGSDQFPYQKKKKKKKRKKKKETKTARVIIIIHEILLNSQCIFFSISGCLMYT